MRKFDSDYNLVGEVKLQPEFGVSPLLAKGGLYFLDMLHEENVIRYVNRDIVCD